MLVIVSIIYSVAVLTMIAKAGAELEKQTETKQKRLLELELQ